MANTLDYWSSETPDIKYLMVVLLSILTFKVIGAYAGIITILFGFIFVMLTSNGFQPIVQSYTKRMDSTVNDRTSNYWYIVRPILYLFATVVFIVGSYGLLVLS